MSIVPKNNNKIVVLAAGLPHYGHDPTLTRKIGGRSVLEWQLHSLRKIEADVELVLGFKASEQKEILGSGVGIVVNENWQATNGVGSLLLIDLESLDELWISYGDVVHHAHAVLPMLDRCDDIVMAVDTEWETRFVARRDTDIDKAEKIVLSANKVLRLGSDVPYNIANAEFAGLVCLRGRALSLLKSLKRDAHEKIMDWSIPDLIEMIRLHGIEVAGVDLKGQWAELNEPKDLAHFVLGTKAETLHRLQGMLRNSMIQDQVSFTVAQWDDDRDAILAQIGSRLKCGKVLVRSSARSEDSFATSNAGAYTSMLDIPNAPGPLADAVKIVIESYDNMSPNDQVLIQPMLENVVMSGVVFTRTLEHAAAYLSINYEESGSTDGITSGRSDESQLMYFRKCADLSTVHNPKLRKLILAIREIEELLNYDALDIEFGIDANEMVTIFQVRPITINQNIDPNLDERIDRKIDQAKSLFLEFGKANSPLVGGKPLFGNMPDWNPAEIIGTNPGKLAYSLYRYLILDDIWAQQRAEYGYKDVRPNGLMVAFAGKPYIDVRASINSFIPKDLPEELTVRLVDFYLDWLKAHPHLHDKIEFDVVPTCLSFDFARWKNRLLKQGGFSGHEVAMLEEALFKVTVAALPRVRQDLSRVALLERAIAAHDKTKPLSLAAIKSILDNCKSLGTLPFAHLARAGFVAITFLKEAVAVNITSQKAQDDFLASLKTVSKSLAEDAHRVSCGAMEFDEFAAIYGHLRPGTYDIRSYAYHENPARFLQPLVNAAVDQKNESKHSAWEEEKTRFYASLRNLGFTASDSDIDAFLRNAIEGREKAKFIFSKSLSLALDAILAWGVENGLGREELSELSIHRILEFKDEPGLDEFQIKQLRDEARWNGEERKRSLACELPPLISSLEDFDCFILDAGHPNFIGAGKITARVAHLADGMGKKDIEISGKIVLIPQADPGYDWLFGQNISGLITMYGGANSHMAIRSAELGLCAAIGVGEKTFKNLAGSTTIELDPRNSIIRIIH